MIYADSVSAKAPELHITIVAAGGDSSSGFALTNEIELVKAALLYGDRVTLASPRASMVGAVSVLGALFGRERDDAVLEIVSQMPEAHDLHAVYTELKRKKHKTREELLAIRQIERGLAESGDALSAKAAEIGDEAGLGELLPAIEEGLLDLDPLGLGEGDTDVMVQKMSDLIAQIVSPTSMTLPMLDDQSGNLLEAMLNEGAIADAQLDGATHAGIASRFVAWVPAFPMADIDAILSAREALRTPLIGYRSAVIDLAREVEESPIDDSFEGRVRDLHMQHVEPALMELEELSNELGLRAAAGKALQSGAGRRIAEAAVGFAAAELAGIPPLLLSTLAVTADIAAQVTRDRQEVERSRRANQFLFLYEADRILSED